MIYLYSFFFACMVCLIGQVILDNTKLTPGHITSLFVIPCVLTFSLFVVASCVKVLSSVISVPNTLELNYNVIENNQSNKN